MASKESNRKMALERIWRLFELAEQFENSEPDFSNRCILRACAIRDKFKVRFPDALRLCYCKKCMGYINQNRVESTKRKTPWIEIHCTHCGADFKRKPVKK